MVLAICGRMSTLLSAVTVPVASSITSTSRFCTATSETLTGGPPAPDAAEPAAPGVPAASAASPVAAPRVNTKAARRGDDGDACDSQDERFFHNLGL